ncbi:MAG: hypothetical protein DRN27_06495 [Thermoplasmata archaeon]|nr:MAG: hypothetical protein DRN27_06495 [Thermoplasmata archaeon]
MVELADANIFSGIKFGALGLGLLIFFGALLIVALIGIAVYFWFNNKQLKYEIPLYKMIGGHLMEVSIFKAKDFKIGYAGDKLWYVPKAKKFIMAGTIQSGKNKFLHFERSDGEWVNFGMGDLDEKMKTAGARYIQSDMRAGRIAISNILEQRFKGKQSFWEKYGSMITQAIFYLIVSVAMVIIFYQWGGIIDRTNELLGRIIAYEDLKCPNIQGVVPALIMLIFRRKK